MPKLHPSTVPTRMKLFYNSTLVAFRQQNILAHKLPKHASKISNLSINYIKTSMCYPLNFHLAIIKHNLIMLMKCFANPNKSPRMTNFGILICRLLPLCVICTYPPPSQLTPKHLIVYDDYKNEDMKYWHILCKWSQSKFAKNHNPHSTQLFFLWFRAD